MSRLDLQEPIRRQLLKSTALWAGAAACWPQGVALAQATPTESVASSEAKAPALPSVGSELALLPEVTLLNGQVFKPAAAKGQVLVIYWWASWCPFCALQSPHMEKLWQTQRERGLQMLALSLDRKREDAVTYLQKKNYTFPAGLVTPEINKLLPKPKGLPVTLVRGRDGRLVHAESGQMFPEDVERIAKFL